MRRHIVRIAIQSLTFTVALCAQTSAPGLRFEVASVRPGAAPKADWDGQGPPVLTPARRVSGLRIDYSRETIKTMISQAYGIDSRLIVGPEWVSKGEDEFRVQAVMPKGSTAADLPAMMKALLEERFHLAVHQIDAEQSGYALVIAKRGHKLKPGRDVEESECKGSDWSAAMESTGVCRMSQVVDDQTVKTTLSRGGPNGPILTRTAGGETHTEFYSITMARFADLVSKLIADFDTRGYGPTTAPVPVVDKTGLSGQWGVFLDKNLGDDRLSSVSESLGKQGLSLERITVPTVKLVIDHVDKVPVEN